MADIIKTWFDAFVDPAGGFHERLDSSLKPIDMPKRLVTQCRQLYVYASAGYDVNAQFDYLYKNYRIEKTGGSRFSLVDDNYDLYGLSFILLACAAMKKTSYARETIHFINDHFRVSGRPGFANALDMNLGVINTPLAQNPHMHLLEGSLAMAEITSDELYQHTANEIVALFFEQFFDGVLHETVGGEVIETGHQSEWIWLLKRYRDVSGSDDPRITNAMVQLYDWVREHAWDKTHGGIFHSQKPDGTVTDSRKRIWPLCETIRAARLMGDEAMAAKCGGLLKSHYLRPNGFWNEILNADLSPATDYVPGTTPYHLFPIISR